MRHLDRRGACAEGDAYCHFVLALADDVGGDTVDADRRDNQRGDREDKEKRRSMQALLRHGVIDRTLQRGNLRNWQRGIQRGEDGRGRIAPRRRARVGVRTTNMIEVTVRASARARQSPAQLRPGRTDDRTPSDMRRRGRIA